jgi:hypothetical protein
VEEEEEEEEEEKLRYVTYTVKNKTLNNRKNYHILF